MAHFLVRHEPTGTEIRWRDGILTSNNKTIEGLLISRAKTAHEAGWKLHPDHFIADNDKAPEHTRDMMAVLALILFETQFGRGLFPDAEVVEFERPSMKEWYERMRETSSLPGRLVLWN